MTGKLILEDKTEMIGKSFGGNKPMAGEVVFATGMMGYPESLTDPSYKGQILVLTYPLIGNYGIPDKIFWESEKIMVSGLIVSTYNETPSHFQSKETLAQWFKRENVPLLEIKDTRFLTQKIREKGTMLGKIIFKKEIMFEDPNKTNLVDLVSLKTKAFIKGSGDKTILLINCGAKRNIEKCLIKRNVNLITVPWDFDPFTQKEEIQFNGILVSNGPGDPKMAKATITTIKKAIARKIPILGICLGNQILALAAGGDTKKLKYGHRSQNQPCRMEDSKRCYITTQNHGFAISKIPVGFKPWFINANDLTIEGIIHKTMPFMSVQFHPEATPGPKDTEWIFDYFLEKI
jgi:carbamoyl-phosphate synthase small subunit